MSIHDDQKLRQAASARLLLAEASSLGIMVGTNGDDIALFAPLRVPYATRRQLEIKLDEIRAAVIEAILQDAGERS